MLYSNSTLVAVTGIGRFAVKDDLISGSICNSITFYQIAQLPFISAISMSCTLFTYIVTDFIALYPLVSLRFKVKLLN